MSTLNRLTTEALIDQFNQLADWEARFDYLLDLAAQLPPLEEADLVDENRISGCLSHVWVKCALSEESPPRLRFVAQSDSQLVGGLIAVLMVVYNGRTLREVLDVDADAVFKQMDLQANLSPTRRNGLHGIVQHLRGRAAAGLHEPR
jgi:cysteine desulfuration protein SufE